MKSERFNFLNSVSVVIPVYNADTFIPLAVQSALQQPELLEVILVEDCSPDGSLAICQDLARQDRIVRLLRHEGGVNKGASASRNLGIQHARGEYVAFLDADDVFLPGRFKNALRILEASPEVDGVYEAIGCIFETKEAERNWRSLHSSLLTTMTAVVPSERLFETLAQWEAGYFSGDGLVVRKSIFERAGLFDEDLELTEDTHMWIKMAAKACLVPGSLNEPVAMRRMHDHNRTTCKPEIGAFYRCMLWRKLLSWGIRERLPLERQSLLLNNYLRATEYYYCSCRWWRVRKLLGLLRLPYVVARWPSAFRMKALMVYVRENLGIILGRRRG